ncbi:MAG: DUF6066 family protein [Myxococcota bacterium]
MRWLVTLAVLAPAVALADADARFAQLRDQAEALSSVSSFVDKYVGECASPLLGGGECVKNAELFRRGATGKKFYMIVTEDSSGALQMGEVNVGKGTLVLNLTPFFAGSNSAITHGAPSKVDANGNPVLPFIRIPAALPEGWNPGLMARQVQSKALRMQIVFTPQGLWTLPRKGGGTIKGVKAKFEAVLVTVGRTGEQVGLWVNK